MEVEEFIKHHGVKGMKWGVRRFQPYPKGSGKKGKFLGKRRASNKAKADRINKKQSGTKLGSKTDKIHSRMSENKSYKKNYDALIKKGRTHRQAVNQANQHATMARSMEIGLKSEAAEHLIKNGRGFVVKRRKK